MPLPRFLLVLFLSLFLLALVALSPWLPSTLAPLRVILGLAFILFLPGYTLQAAIFAHPNDLDTPQRLALSFGLSLAAVPFVALLLDKLPWGIQLWPVMISEGALIVLSSLVAVLRHWRLPQAERGHGGPGLRLWWRGVSRADRLLYFLLAGILLTATLAAAAILLLPRPAQFFTEFFLLGPEGLAESYPRQAHVGEDLQVTLGIANHEDGDRAYRLEVWVTDTWNPERRQQVFAAGPIPLDQGQTFESSLPWRMPWAGKDQQVDFLLFLGDNPLPYRSLRLTLDVAGTP